MKYDNGIDGIDLRPNYRLKNDTIKITETKIISPSSPEELRKIADEERKSIQRRDKNFSEGVDLFSNFQRLDVETIDDTPCGWNLFDDATEIEIIDLMRSVETIGLINPIHVSLDIYGNYRVICGRSRLIAYTRLYLATDLEKYKFIPAYVINTEEVDELFLRTMIIESNISFRSISKFNLIQSLITNYEIAKITKLARNESNVAEELARVYGMSESSVFNYLRIKKLCDPALTLLYDDKITLKSALYLTKVSKETQENILERFGVKGVNTIFKLKLITKEGNISIEKLDEKIRDLEKFTPPKTRITIEIAREFASPLLEHILLFKKGDITKFANNYTRGNTNKIFKVKYDEETMGFYVKENIVDEMVLKKLSSKKTSEKVF